MMMYYMTYIHVESVKKSVYDELETVLSFEILFENTCIRCVSCLVGLLPARNLWKYTHTT